MEQMVIGPEASDYGPSDNENQRSVRSNGTGGHVQSRRGPEL